MTENHKERKMISKLEMYNILSNILGNNLDHNLIIDNAFFLGAISWENNSEKINYSKKCKITIDIFNSFFNKYFDEIIIVTSLHINYKKLKVKTLEYDLSTKGYILPFSEKIIYNNENTDNHEIFSELNSSFRMFKNFISQDILDLSFLMMGSETLPIDSGYLFFILPKQNLIIYPHSDIGYGAFCMNLNKKTGLWDKFENHISKKTDIISNNIVNTTKLFKLIK